MGSFRYLDKANPGRGLLTAAQVPELAAAAGPSTAVERRPCWRSCGGRGSRRWKDAQPPIGAGSVRLLRPQPQPAMNGPSALKSDGFMTDRPADACSSSGVSADELVGQHSVRMQSDPVAREAAAAQDEGRRY